MAQADTLPTPGASSAGQAEAVKMAGKLAYRNLFHDRLSLIVTLTGIVFSVVLVAVQCGLYIGSERMIAAMLDQSKGDLWVAPLGTKSFDDPSLLIGHEKYSVLSTKGVAGSEELVVGFAAWRKPKGGMTAVLIVGSDHEERHAEALEPCRRQPRRPRCTVFGRRRRHLLQGSRRREKRRDGRDQRHARQDRRRDPRHPLLHDAALRVHFLEPRPHAARCRQQPVLLYAGAAGARRRHRDRAPDLTARLQDREILTQQEFRNRSVDYWLFQTGAGSALIAGAALGMIVGVVIVAQTLYSSTKDHLNEFATLRALGASAGYIHKVILFQAMMLGRGRLRHRHGAVDARHLGVEGYDLVHHHDAGPRPASLRSHHWHVRHRRRVGHLQGDPHRSRRSVQPMTANPDRKVLLEATQHREGVRLGRLRGQAAERHRPQALLGRADAADGSVGLRQDDAAVDPRLHPVADRGPARRGRQPDASASTPKASPTSGASTSASSSRATTCSPR